MLTIRFDELALGHGALVLDVGTGFGRHAFEVARRGGRVVALDYADDEVAGTRDTFAAMVDAGEIAEDHYVGVLRGDATRLPFADDSFDAVITSEVLEHIQDDVGALSEMVRVLKPGGRFAATVPSWMPEMVNWKLSDEYHAPKAAGGHVRIYTATELRAKLRAAGLGVTGDHRAHALHSPYWWLKCAVGVDNDDHPAVTAYRRFLEWDIISQPRATRLADRVLSPVLGKSTVLYATKLSELDSQASCSPHLPSSPSPLRFGDSPSSSASSTSQAELDSQASCSPHLPSSPPPLRFGDSPSSTASSTSQAELDSQASCSPHLPSSPPPLRFGDSPSSNASTSRTELGSPNSSASTSSTRKDPQ